MANVNDMNFNQLSTVLNDIVSQATGQKTITPVNSSEFISVAQLGLKTGYDPLATAISQVLSKTIFSERAYNGKFKSFNVSNTRYGNHVRKLQVVDQEFEDDQRFDLVDGQSIDMYEVLKPKVVQTNWYGANPYQKHMTVYRDQLDCAFNSPDEFQRFLSMIFTNANNQITQAKESCARSTLSNLIGATLQSPNAANQAINVLTEYNTWAGTTLTSTTLFNPDNYPNFVRWFYGFLQNRSDFLTERSSLYHQQIGNDPIMRHTSRENQRLYIQSTIERLMETVVTSTTYHDEKTVFPPHETVNYWQSISSPTSIQVTPAIINSSGEADTGTAIDETYIAAVLFDYEAAGITTVNEWAAATPFNAAGGYYNHYWHFTTRFWNDFSENAIVFYIKD